VKRLCRILEISRSSYYYWRSSTPIRAARDAADVALAQRITMVHAASDGTYGAPRITAELRDHGVPVNRKRVARVMRRFGVQGLRLRRRTRTTVPDPAAAKAPDLIGRDFTATAPNLRYVGDITYLPIGDRGFLYLATVIDLCSRRLAGWAIADHMRTTWSSMPCTPPSRPEAACTGRFCIPTTEPSTHREPSPTPAPPPGSANR
jgi:hypothetical protein